MRTYTEWVLLYVYCNIICVSLIYFSSDWIYYTFFMWLTSPRSNNPYITTLISCAKWLRRWTFHQRFRLIHGRLRGAPYTIKNGQHFEAKNGGSIFDKIFDVLTPIRPHTFHQNFDQNSLCWKCLIRMLLLP